MTVSFHKLEDGYFPGKWRLESSSLLCLMLCALSTKLTRKVIAAHLAFRMAHFNRHRFIYSLIHSGLHFLSSTPLPQNVYLDSPRDDYHCYDQFHSDGACDD